MFILELIARLAGPEVLAVFAALLTALGPAVLAFRKGKGHVIWSSGSPEPVNEPGESKESGTEVTYASAPIQRKIGPKGRTPDSRGSTMLASYAVVLVIFGTIATIHYWDLIKQREDLAFTMGGLLLSMIAGMFVQVITSNYKASSPLFHVTSSQLMYPLLFSPIVFYPVWALSTGGSQHLFAFYAAFLDGYFWESVVSSAKPPNNDHPTGKPRGHRRNRRTQILPT